jgi:hypothetical protein
MVDMAKHKLPADILEYFRREGSRGGKLGGSAGGKAAAARMTPKQRVARAKKAGVAAAASRSARKAR